MTALAPPIWRHPTGKIRSTADYADAERIPRMPRGKKCRQTIP